MRKLVEANDKKEVLNEKLNMVIKAFETKSEKRIMQKQEEEEILK